MRMDRRYNRVRGIITDDVVPRTDNGGIALCHHCQRMVAFAGSFLTYLIQKVKRTASNDASLGRALLLLKAEIEERTP